jgi:hypothetical protein
MRLPRMRFTIRQVMIIVAAIAALVWLAIGLIDLKRSLPDLTYRGWNTYLLPAGQRVVILGDIRAAVASKFIHPTGDSRSKPTHYNWQIVTPGGEHALAAGTPGVVKIDPAWDDDSCDPERPIAVQVSAGTHKGVVVALPRNRLRRR